MKKMIRIYTGNEIDVPAKFKKHLVTIKHDDGSIVGCDCGCGGMGYGTYSAIVDPKVMIEFQKFDSDENIGYIDENDDEKH